VTGLGGRKPRPKRCERRATADFLWDFMQILGIYTFYIISLFFSARSIVPWVLGLDVFAYKNLCIYIYLRCRFFIREDRKKSKSKMLFFMEKQ
jgi:hypothetical protein